MPAAARAAAGMYLVVCRDSSVRESLTRSADH